jgi:type IV pilus assembly protein PilN
VTRPVILINLLPHREVRRQQRKQAFFAGIGASAVAGVLVVGAWYTLVQQAQAAQEARNAFLQAEIAKLDAQIKDIANLRNEIDALKARQRAVEDLQTDRNLPVHLLDELVRHVPEGVQLSAIRQSGDVVSISGLAQTNERVSELLRNAANGAQWLERPELVEIKALQPAANSRDQRRLFEFQMRVTLRRPQPAAGAASAPAPRPPAAT